MTKLFQSAEIESAIQQLMQKKNAVATVEKVCDFLGCNREDEELKRRLHFYLAGDDAFYSLDDENFYRRSDFFNGESFVITPTAWEVENDILIIGHRFQTFVNPEIFPSEITVKSGRKNIAKKLLCEKLENIFPYHMLMGAEQLSDFFIGEDVANAHWKSKSGFNVKININILDMKDFYLEKDMKFGDALFFTVLDYDKGNLKVSKIEASGRNPDKIIEWCRTFEDKVGEIADKFESYPDLPEQLRMAYFLGGKSLFGKEGASLDEFIQGAEKVEIAFDSDHTILVRRTDEEIAENPELPDGISISSGESSSLKAILKSIGSSLSEIEIDSYILESCFDRDRDFDAFLNKVFDFEKLSFADEAQQTVFLNFLEDRFEQLSANYNRFNDEEKAPLRSRILEIVTARNDFFNYIKSLDIDEKNIPQDEMKKIASGAMHLNSILQMLNDERHDLSEEDKEAIFEAVESAEDILNGSMETLEIALKI